ncbi:aminopeptidase [Pseudomonas matsuisoli]|uniref:Aminopeptidase n=1 Tax=Pseudomonas matsuisoli TaxID=1515666 RepID=A0A917PV29_9PSED|nr:aminopeptidase [Pseudomonas matsuisoli]GGJ93218.1 aminopeptidase [Pseudomonas matsuisoli]
MPRSNAGLLDHGYRLWVPLLICLCLAGCSTAGYYSQLAHGHLALMAKREPISQVMSAPETSPALRAKLALSQQARTFASDTLALPDNSSYRVYTDLGRPYVVWNLFATEEFSLEPVTHCFPIAGCVAYRGFYDPNRARGAAALLKLDGKDTYIAGIEAYSTLGWFDDPLLSSMLHWSDDRLSALIFHELAHQRLYVPNDTAFNESFATFVEREGLRQWRVFRGLPAEPDTMVDQRERFTRLVLDLRTHLQRLYEEPLEAPTLRDRKRAAFDRFRREYRALRDREWPNDHRYDRWVEGPLNNASLLPFGLYDQWVPAFAALFERAGRDWHRFYEAVAELGKQPAVDRQSTLEQLTESQ